MAPNEAQVVELRTLSDCDLPGCSRIAEEDALIAACKEGDREAFDQLFKRYRHQVVRMIAGLIHGQSHQEEVIQEIFIQVFRSIRTFKHKSRFSTWLYRVSINVAGMYLRKHKRHLQEYVELEQATALGHPTGPEEHLAAHQTMVRLTRALDALPIKKRIVFVLHDLKNLSIEEIAEVMGCPLGTVRTRLFHARRELLEQITPAGKGER